MEGNFPRFWMKAFQVSGRTFYKFLERSSFEASGRKFSPNFWKEAFQASGKKLFSSLWKKALSKLPKGNSLQAPGKNLF